MDTDGRLTKIEEQLATIVGLLTKRDRTNAERQARWRARNTVTVTPLRNVIVTPQPQPQDAPRTKRVRKVKHSIPDDFQLTGADIQFARAHGFDQQRIQREFGRFCDHAVANDRKQADWRAAWRSWVTSPLQNSNGNEKPHNDQPRRKTIQEVARDLCNQRLDAGSRDDDAGTVSW